MNYSVVAIFSERYSMTCQICNIFAHNTNVSFPDEQKNRLHSVCCHKNGNFQCHLRFVCDAKTCITNCVAKWLDASRDSWIFQESALCQYIQERKLFPYVIQIQMWNRVNDFWDCDDRKLSLLKFPVWSWGRTRRVCIDRCIVT